MRHNLCMVGYAFRLRPLTDDDAPFVLKLRNDPSLNKFLHFTESDLNAQLAWQAAYYERAGDYYFVIESTSSGMPEGLISLYQHDSELGSAEWGRWILRRNSLAAVESALLIYRSAFETLCLNEVYCRTVANNRPVVSFHDSCGITTKQTLHSHFNFGDKTADAIEHRVTKNDSILLMQRLAKLAELTARRIHRE